MIKTRDINIRKILIPRFREVKMSPPLNSKDFQTAFGFVFFENWVTLFHVMFLMFITGHDYIHSAPIFTGVVLSCMNGFIVVAIAFYLKEFMGFVEGIICAQLPFTLSAAIAVLIYRMY